MRKELVISKYQSIYIQSSWTLAGSVHTPGYAMHLAHELFSSGPRPDTSLKLGSGFIIIQLNLQKAHKRAGSQPIMCLPPIWHVPSHCPPQTEMTNWKGYPVDSDNKAAKFTGGMVWPEFRYLQGYVRLVTSSYSLSRVFIYLNLGRPCNKTVRTFSN